MRAALGLNDRRNRAEEILLLQGVNQTLLIFIRDKVAAIGVGADFQHILYVVVVALADVVPECRLVCLGSDAGLVVRFILRAGFAGKREQRSEQRASCRSLPDAADVQCRVKSVTSFSILS